VTLRQSAIVAALLAVPAMPAVADDVGITSARLLELADGGYAIEADVSPRMVAALRAPIVPERFTRIEKPSYRRVGVGLVVRYEFGGSDTPLRAGDVLVLPWARSAVLLTTRWRDGTAQRAMFPRGPTGIRVPIEALRPIERSRPAVARQHLGAALEGAGANFIRLLVILALVAAASGWRAVRLALVFAAGHALSMVALDLGIPAVPAMPVEGALAVGVILLARSVFRDDGARLWPLVLMLGLIDGLGIAGIVSRSTGPGEIVAALFGAILGLDVVLLIAVAALAGARRAVGATGSARLVATAIGSFAVAALIATTAAGLRADRVEETDPADRMAAARFDFTGSGGSAGSTSRAAAAPRRLDDAAVIFLTVEPVEVRVEVLLGLRSFLEPLRIEGGPGSVVSVEAQGEIAARAKRMVAETLEVDIDGRKAVPLLQRTDFVTVAATGVTTRREPRPERLAAAVLGVTMIYGVDGPPMGIETTWRIFPTTATTIPAVWTDPAGSARVTLTPEEPTLYWEGDLSSYETPPVSAIDVRAPRWPLISLVLAALAAAIWIGRRRWAAVAWLALAVATLLYPFARSPVPGFRLWAPARAETAEVVDGLLTNIYRSFGLRNEEAIYDRLAVSVTGEQLSEIYLENRRALEIENRGGARARVDEVEVLEVRSVRRADDGGYEVDATWTVSGSVNHFGHVHYRQNRYDALIHLDAVDGVWKIREIEVLDERRIL
jgi:hypothetical protein